MRDVLLVAAGLGAGLLAGWLFFSGAEPSAVENIGVAVPPPAEVADSGVDRGPKDPTATGEAQPAPVTPAAIRTVRQAESPAHHGG